MMPLWHAAVFIALLPATAFAAFVFTASGTLKLNQTSAVNILLVGGGGGASSYMAGGGGGGGVIYAQGCTLQGGIPYPITVGQGGTAGSLGTVITANNGGATTAFDAVANGGGGGLKYGLDVPTNNGGSGAGQPVFYTSPSAVRGGEAVANIIGSGPIANCSTVVSYGNNGGLGGISDGFGASGGGGGGAASAGLNGYSQKQNSFGPSNGGDGFVIPMPSGNSFAWAAGGGGSGSFATNWNDYNPSGWTPSTLSGKGGNGGGGRGCIFTYDDQFVTFGTSGSGGYPSGTAASSADALANTGSGGGGGCCINCLGGQGGSGIVIVEYTPSPVPTTAPVTATSAALSTTTTPSPVPTTTTTTARVAATSAALSTTTTPSPVPTTTTTTAPVAATSATTTASTTTAAASTTTLPTTTPAPTGGIITRTVNVNAASPAVVFPSWINPLSGAVLPAAAVKFEQGMFLVNNVQMTFIQTDKLDPAVTVSTEATLQTAGPTITISTTQRSVYQKAISLEMPVWRNATVPRTSGNITGMSVVARGRMLLQAQPLSVANVAGHALLFYILNGKWTMLPVEFQRFNSSVVYANIPPSILNNQYNAGVYTIFYNVTDIAFSVLDSTPAATIATTPPPLTGAQKSPENGAGVTVAIVVSVVVVTVIAPAIGVVVWYRQRLSHGALQNGAKPTMVAHYSLFTLSSDEAFLPGKGRAL